MTKTIPFFEMFAELQVSAELRLRLAGAQIKHVWINLADAFIRLQMSMKNELSDGDRRNLQDTFQRVYGFQKAELEI